MAIALTASTSWTAPPAEAHTHVTVEPYNFTVGWREEPPFVGVVNGLDLEVAWHANGTAVLRAHRDLNATLTKGSSSTSPILLPQFGRDGWYTFDVIPTEAGVYRVRIHGNLNGTPIDFPAELQEVRPASSVEFPRANPTPGELQGQVTLLLAIATGGLILAAASTATAVVLARRLRPRA